MRLDALNYVACPVCKSELSVEIQTEQAGDHIITGSLVCTSCSSSYPITRGVPRLFETGVRDADLDTGAAYEAYFGEVLSDMFDDEGRLYGLTLQEEITDFCKKTRLDNLNTLHGSVFLDAGCGIGRIDGLLAKHCRTVVGVDITPAVERAFQLWRDTPNIHIVQGNLVSLPVLGDKFDFVWCDGALPYVSDFDQSLRELVRARTVAGSLYTWCYDERITFKERIGRFFHWTRLPINIRFIFIRLVALLAAMMGSIIRRKNMFPIADTYAQGILDWSLAAKVNHVSEQQVGSAVNELESNVQITSQKQHVELYINLPPA